MTTLREAAQQALEALEQDNPGGRSATITALRAALAQPDRAQRMRDADYTRRPTLREMAQPERGSSVGIRDGRRHAGREE